MVGGLHRGGHIHHHAVFQLAVHILFAGGHGLLTLRPMLQGGGPAGVAEVQAGVDILGVIGDGLSLHLVLVVHPVHRDLTARSDQLIQRRLGVVICLQGDAGALQRLGNGAKGHLHRVLLAVGLDVHGEGPLNVQGGKIAAERGVVNVVALFGLNAGKAHDAGRVSLIADHQLTRTIGVGDVGQPQIRGGHGQSEHKAHCHDAERQHTGCDRTSAVRQCFLKFDGSDTRQLLSFHHFGMRRALPLPAKRRAFFPAKGRLFIRRFTS